MYQNNNNNVSLESVLRWRCFTSHRHRSTLILLSIFLIVSSAIISLFHTPSKQIQPFKDPSDIVYPLKKYEKNDDISRQQKLVLTEKIHDNPLLDYYPYSLLRNVHDPVQLDPKYDNGGDIPLFWHIHKSGGSSMKHIFTCLRKVQTRRTNTDNPNIGCNDQDPTTLRVCNIPFGSEDLGSRVINVDASSELGIERAINLGLTKWGKVKGLKDRGKETFIIDTSRVYEALPIFTPTRRARLFVVFRHPVERAISKYYYSKIATWERNYNPQVAKMTLMEYANSKLCYNNWVTRRIVNKMEGELAVEDLDLAKEFIREKALVLLLEDMDEAVKRIRTYFGWDKEPLDKEQNHCLAQFAHDDPVNVNKKNKEKVLPTDPEWDVIRKKNLMDFELMVYAREVYKEQGKMLYG